MGFLSDFPHDAVLLGLGPFAATAGDQPEAAR